MENSPILTEITAPQLEKSPGKGKTIIIALFVLMVPVVFFWSNQHGALADQSSGSETGFVLKMDKEDPTYHAYETPVFEIKNARPNENFRLQLFRNGRAFDMNLLSITTDATGHAYFRTGLTSDDTIGKWKASIASDTGTHSVDFEIRGGCADTSDVTITADKKEYREGDKISFVVKGPSGSQIHWFGLVTRNQKVVSLDENQAYYGDLVNQRGEWKSRDIIAKSEGSETKVNTIISVCDKTANVAYKVMK